MARITISDLHPHDLEALNSYLEDMEDWNIFGGEADAFYSSMGFGLKFLEFVSVIYAMDTISWLTKSFYSTK